MPRNAPTFSSILVAPLVLHAQELYRLFPFIDSFLPQIPTSINDVSTTSSSATIQWMLTDPFNPSPPGTVIVHKLWYHLRTTRNEHSWGNSQLHKSDILHTTQLTTTRDSVLLQNRVEKHLWDCIYRSRIFLN